jgi:hypothetical protein
MPNGKSQSGSFVKSAKEAAVIIVSILVAFSLDAWWERVQVERDVQDILQAIRVETEINLTKLRESAAHRELIIEAMTTSLQNQDQGTRGINNIAIIEFEDFEPSSGAMDTLVATGLLAEVENSELRLLLGTSASLIKDLNERESRALEFRNLARRRLAALGNRIWQADDPGTADIETLNLLAMRRVEERNALQSAIRLQKLLQEILDRLQD